MDVSINGEDAHRLVFGLFGTLAPKTVENFKQLALCQAGHLSSQTALPLCYKGSKFHRVVSHFGVQGGDFTHGTGVGGESIYGGRFQDESFQVKFNRPYVLAMANNGRNTNGSQFFVTTVKAQWLDGKHVIFGTVLHGRSFVDEMESYGTYGGTPTHEMVIVDCGTEPLHESDKEPHYS
jgi:cyclophilin family peptidyl-prolyl cis-trans isomerase